MFVFKFAFLLQYNDNDNTKSGVLSAFTLSFTNQVQILLKSFSRFHSYTLDYRTPKAFILLLTPSKIFSQSSLDFLKPWISRPIQCNTTRVYLFIISWLCTISDKIVNEKSPTWACGVSLKHDKAKVSYARCDQCKQRAALSVLME